MVVPDRVIFLLEADKKTDDQIQQFENDLIYKNRFSSKSAVILKKMKLKSTRSD